MFRPQLLLATLFMGALIWYVPSPAQAGFQDVAYTVVINDPDEATLLPWGAVDVTKVSIGEPQNGTITVKIQTRAGDMPPAGAMRYTFSTSVGAMVRLGTVDQTGKTAVGNTIFSGCALEGGVFYCSIKCGTYGFDNGVVMSANYAFDQVIQGSGAPYLDYAPGGLYSVETSAAGTRPKGTDYTIQVCSDEAEAPPVYEDVSDAVLLIESNFTVAETRTYQFNWSNGAQDLRLELVGNASAGSANVTVKDGKNITVYEGSVDGATEDARDVSGAPGPWVVSVQYAEFTGTLRLSVFPRIQGTDPTDPGTTGTGPAGSSGSTNGTDETGQAASNTGGGAEGDTPSVPAVATAVCAAAAVGLARRRASKQEGRKQR